MNSIKFKFNAIIWLWVLGKLFRGWLSYERIICEQTDDVSKLRDRWELRLNPNKPFSHPYSLSSLIIKLRNTLAMSSPQYSANMATPHSPSSVNLTHESYINTNSLLQVFETQRLHRTIPHNTSCAVVFEAQRSNIAEKKNLATGANGTWPSMCNDEAENNVEVFESRNCGIIRIHPSDDVITRGGLRDVDQKRIFPLFHFCHLRLFGMTFLLLLPQSATQGLHAVVAAFVKVGWQQTVTVQK